MERLLKSNGGFGRDALGLVEMSEASAAQALAVRDAFDLSDGALSPDGGALVRGHPLGAASAVSVVRLFTRMARLRNGHGPSLGAVTQGAPAGSASPPCSRRSERHDLQRSFCWTPTTSRAAAMSSAHGRSVRLWLSSRPRPCIRSALGRTGNGGGKGYAGGNLRLHRDRRRLGRLRGGRAAFGVGPLPGAAARSRPARQLSLDPHSRRLPQALHARHLQLEIRERARCRPQRPHLLPAARQDARRHQLAQRHGLHARHGGRLRRLAPARLRRLGLRERAALLPQGRGPGARRGRVPRRRRPAQGHRRPLHARDHRRHHRGGGAGRHPAQSPTSTARRRKASATTRRPSATVGAGAPRSPI